MWGAENLLEALRRQNPRDPLDAPEVIKPLKNKMVEVNKLADVVRTNVQVPRDPLDVERNTIGNLRTTTKFTTTTSVDSEKSGTRTLVSAGKRKLKMQSDGRSTTTTLNVNTNAKL